MISVGNSKNAPYLAYGDDSAYEEVLAYVFFLLRKEYKNELEKDILYLKKKYGIPENIPIHLKNLFSARYRRINNITKLERNRHPSFFRNVVRILNRNKCVVRFCYTIIPEGGRLYDEDDESEPIQLIENHKAILHQMAAMCFTPYQERGVTILTANDFEVFLSKDTTRVKTVVGQPRKQAQFCSEVIIPVSAPMTSPLNHRLKPNYEDMSKNIFLQFADSVAYLVSHAMSGKCSEEHYKKNFSKITMFIRHILHTENNTSQSINK